MSFVLQGIERHVGAETWLSGIDLTLRPGGLTVLLGRTGAGKTSLLRLIAGLDRPTAGALLEDGRDVVGVPVNKRKVAFVYQQFINYPSFTVFDNIAAPLRREGLAKAQIDARVREVAASVRIDHLLDRFPAQLSGGQQQRVAIARALAKQAPLVLLDEPLVNLDYKLREELRAELRTIFRGGRQIVVYSTTEPDEALQMGGTTVVMHEGRILQVGPAAEVHRNPASTTVADIFSEPPMNIASGRIGEGLLHVAGRSVPLPPHLAGQGPGACRVGILPHHVHLDPRGADALPLGGPVSLAEVDGSSTFTHFEMQGQHWIVQREGVHPQPPGSIFSGFVDPADFYLFDDAGRLMHAPSRDAAGGHA